MRRHFPENPEPVLLPQAQVWNSPEHVAEYARSCMDICGLHDWRLEWDHAVRRLGCCKMSQRTLSLSRYFVEAYLSRDQMTIRSTILHELAHALAWEQYRERGHGAAWHYWCAALGIPEEKSVVKCVDFTPDHLRKSPKYALIHRETGEVYRYYNRQPRMSLSKLKHCYIPGKKESTLGKLTIIPINNEASPNVNL